MLKKFFNAIVAWFRIHKILQLELEVELMDRAFIKQQDQICLLWEFILGEQEYLNKACEMNSDNEAAYAGLRDSWNKKIEELNEHVFADKRASSEARDRCVKQNEDQGVEDPGLGERRVAFDAGKKEVDSKSSLPA